MASYVALLRAVNVGGNNPLPMADLRTAAMRAGASRPRTYLQSGNLVFDADPAAIDGITAKLAAQIKAPMVIRRGEELLAARRACPWVAEATADHTAVHVGFFDQAPDPAKVAALDPARGGEDRFAVVGREVFVHYKNGSGRTKLDINWFEGQLGVTSTFRNWRTVLELLKMAEVVDDAPAPAAAARPVALSYVMVNVTDMSRSVAFYRDALGLECLLETPFWSEFQTGGIKIALHGGGTGAPAAPATAGTASLGFHVTDLDATHALLVSRGVTFTLPPTDRPQERLRLAVATDPDGLPLNFAQGLRA